MLSGDRLAQDGLVEGGEVKASGISPDEGALVIGTVAA